jgi:hypothetical protein
VPARRRLILVIDQIVKFTGKRPQSMMKFGHAIAESEDHLDSGEVNPQVAMEAHDRPEAANLGRFVPLDLTFERGVDQPETLVTRQKAGRDRQLPGDLIARNDESSHRRSGPD